MTNINVTNSLHYTVWHILVTLSRGFYEKKNPYFPIPDDFEALFCIRVKVRRLELNMTAEELGEYLYWIPQQVYRLESGLFPRDEWRIVAIAKALDVSLDWLFGLTDNLKD